MLWSQGRKKGSEVLTQWESMCLACVRPQGKAGRGRKTTLESKAYSNSKNSCLPSPHFARLCWQVVTSWLWPAVLGYLVPLLAFPVETLDYSAQPPATPWRLSYLVCSTLPLATPLHFTPPTPWLSALGGRQHTLPHTLMPGWGCSSSACLFKLVQNSWRQMLDLTHYLPQRLAHSLYHRVHNQYQIYNYQIVKRRNEWATVSLPFMPLVCVLNVLCDPQFQAWRIYSNKHKPSLNWINLWVLTSSALLFFWAEKN